MTVNGGEENLTCPMRPMSAEIDVEAEKVPFLLYAVRRLFKRGIIPSTLYKIFLRLTPSTWMPKAPFARSTVIVDGQQKSITVDLNDTIGKEVYLYGWYDKMVLDFTRKLIKRLKSDQPLIFVDVGASIGNHTLYLSDLFNRVFSFEPNPVAYGRLSNNVVNSGLGYIETIPIGLSDRKARRPFAIPNKYDNLGSARIVDSDKQQLSIDVDCGDALLEGKLRGDLALIKIDVEGHERNVVAGLDKVIKRHLPIIMFEYSSDTMRNDGLFIRDRLKKFDYFCFGTKYSPPWVQLLTLSNSMKLYDFNFEHRCETVFAVPEKRMAQFMALAEALDILR